MSDDTVNSQEEFVEVSDEEADKLFENGGILDEPNPEPEEESTEGEKEVENEVEAKVEEVAEEPPKEEKKVNLGALHEERAKRKELESKMAVMEDRFKQLVQNLNPNQEAKLPGVEDDPVTNFDQRIAQAEQYIKQSQEQQQAQYQHQQVVNAYQAQAAEYVKETPDFNDAYSYVLQGRLSELDAFGVTKEQALQVVQQEEYEVALKSLQDGVNPAERIYKIAQLRGYKKAEAKPEQKKDLAVIEKGQKTAKVSGSATPEGELSLEALAEMDDAAFEDAWKKLEKQNSK
jgi:hypothetical protein